MDSQEIGEELKELEERIERLRALYEQYFQGIERIEPQTLRKDVERRIWGLRREQIRNTGLRFRFQMLVQRFNTYQQYWGRVTREIENGTYRRDVLRVAARFGEKEALTIAGRKRAELYLALAAAQTRRRGGDAEEGRAGSREEVFELDDDALELEELEEAAPPAARTAPGFGEVDVGFGTVEEPAPAPAPRAPRRRISQLVAAVRAKPREVAPRRPTTPEAGPLDLDLDLDLGPSSKRRAPSVPPARPPSPRRTTPEPARPPEPAPRAFPPEPPKPAPKVAAPPPRPPPPTTPDPAARPADLSETRLRQIYETYVESKRRQNESTAGVSYERMAETLRSQARKLRTEYRAKTVDYEVVVQNGKTLLKPILK